MAVAFLSIYGDVRGMKYRPHRGTLADSMAEEVTLHDSLDALVEHLRCRPEDLAVKAYGHDHRLRANVYLVLVNDAPVGWTDGIPGSTYPEQVSEDAWPTMPTDPAIIDLIRRRLPDEIPDFRPRLAKDPSFVRDSANRAWRLAWSRGEWTKQRLVL